MKKIKRIIAGAVLLCGLGSFTGCSNNANTVVDPSTVLAEVNGRQVTLADVDLELTPYIDSLKEQVGEDYESKISEEIRLQFNSQRATVLNQIIQEEILLAKAKELNLIPSNEELALKVEEYINQLKEYYGGEEGLNQLKEQSKYTDESFNTLIENQIIQELVVQDITKDITVSEDEMKTYYEDHKDTFFTQQPGAVSQHILFKTEEEAKKCLEEINSGEIKFEEAFDKYKDNAKSETYPLAESLGFIEYEQEGFDKDFLKGLKNTEQGKISEPVKSSFGYHIIKAIDVYKDKKVLSFEESKDSIEEQLLYEKQYELYQSKLTLWKKEFNVKITAEAIGYSPEEE